ncbi:MAG: zinc ribbon domain-containing protein [Myxococcales bacterium]|nr:zinc ribbon domain-containing protein [Myxococcota bacterium]MDW8282948.1 zinc ribbon domain-containing protein [Myxococcales bacterium]
MPIYEYLCSDCGTRFEAIVWYSEQASCSQCQSSRLERLPSHFAIAGASRRGASASSAQTGSTGTGGEDGSEGPKFAEFRPDDPYKTTNEYYGDDL